MSDGRNHQQWDDGASEPVAPEPVRPSPWAPPPRVEPYPPATPPGAPAPPVPSQRGHTESGYTEPGYAEPGYAGPGYTDPAYAEPGYSEPGYSERAGFAESSSSPWAPADEPQPEPQSVYVPEPEVTGRVYRTTAPAEYPVTPFEYEPTPEYAPAPRVAPAAPPPPPSRHRGLWVTLGVLVLAVAVGAGVLIGMRLADDGPSRRTGVADPCVADAVLKLTVAPELAPVVETAVRDLGGETGAGCRPVAVVAQPPAETVAKLGSSPPEGWIPPSVAWLRLAAGTGQPPASGAPSAGTPGSSSTPTTAGITGYFADRPVSVARTPVVVAVPTAYALSLGWPAKQPTWAELATRVTSDGGPRLSVEHPLRGTSGLLTVLGVNAAMARTTADPGIAQMRALTLRSRLADPAADPSALLARMAQQTDPDTAMREIGAFAVTEQALYGYVKEKRTVPLTALYPPDGLGEADYPLLLSTRAAGDPARRDLADRLAARMRSPEFANTLTSHGFRSPAGAGTAAPKADGLLASPPAAVPVPADAAQVAQVAGQWAAYQRLAYQVLVMVDGSASMNDPVRDKAGRTTTKGDLLRLAGVQAAQLFGEETSLALWMFASPTPTAPPYTELIPFGPLDENIGGVPRREVLRRTAQGYKAYDQAGTPLYESVLRGTAAMRARFKPDAVTLVVVLTDGRDQDSRFAMSRTQFIARLSADRDPAKPVPVFCIGYGNDADMPALTDIARLTGGRAVASNDPGDLASAMARVFLAAHQSR